ncbi:MAG: hypothetical protein LC125_06785 [Burkholderiales bacterium]|nr:hypothetical protein [Burkholderiales bacterium]
MKPIDDPELTAACRRYGARRVHDAAMAGLYGRMEPLRALGLPARGAPDAHDALRVAYALLDDEDRAAVDAEAVIGLARLAR